MVYRGRVNVLMTWGWAPDGLAAGAYASVEDAAEGLADSARRVTGVYGPGTQTRIMQNCVPSLQHRMRTEAVPALEAGESWSGECGGVYVRLEPTREPPHT